MSGATPFVVVGFLSVDSIKTAYVLHKHDSLSDDSELKEHSLKNRAIKTIKLYTKIQKIVDEKQLEMQNKIKEIQDKRGSVIESPMPVPLQIRNVVEEANEYIKSSPELAEYEEVAKNFQILVSIFDITSICSIAMKFDFEEEERFVTRICHNGSSPGVLVVESLQKVMASIQQAASQLNDGVQRAQLRNALSAGDIGGMSGMPVDPGVMNAIRNRR
jgi:hypothetical protein